MIITCMQEVIPVKLSSSDTKSLFRIVSPNHELAWGEEVSVHMYVECLYFVL